MHFEKKGQLHTLNIWKVIESEKYGYLNARISRFGTPLKSEHVHGLQSLPKSARQNLHLNFPLSEDKFN